MNFAFLLEKKKKTKSQGGNFAILGNAHLVTHFIYACQIFCTDDFHRSHYVEYPIHISRDPFSEFSCSISLQKNYAFLFSLLQDSTQYTLISLFSEKIHNSKLLNYSSIKGKKVHTSLTHPRKRKTKVGLSKFYSKTLLLPSSICRVLISNNERKEARFRDQSSIKGYS